MSYITLGSRQVAGAADITGLNPGKFTNYFSVAALGVNVPFYEVYSISVTGLAQVATVIVYVEGKVRSTAKLLGNSEWDPSQPILLKAADEVAVCWDFGTGTAPTAVAWLRYDPALNKGVF